MTLAEKIASVKTLLGNDAAATDALVTEYLSEAADDILRRLYAAYGGSIPSGATVPAFYDYLQVKLAQRRFLKRGAEGESSHSENGISRNYGSVDDEDLLMQVLPYAKLFGSAASEGDSE